MIAKLIKSISNQKSEDRKAELYRNLLRHEAKIGGQLFGEVPKKHRREFFCLDANTWIWHEEWLENGQRRSKTTRYDVRPTVILKAQDGQPYQVVGPEEVKNLVQAAKMYEDRVVAELYSAV
jgi:hypothetical protein